MSCASSEEQIREFYDFAAGQGFTEELFLRGGHCDRFVETAANGYREYPLFQQIFGGSYDEKTLARMMAVDFKYRQQARTTAGIASSPEVESVLLIEPPGTKKPDLAAYIRSANPRSYSLLLKPSTYRQLSFEAYARKKRKPFLDEKTWYLYLFATRTECRNQGHGKKLLRLVLDFADAKDCRICLETNLQENIGMYEHFGFRLTDTSMYGNRLQHCVMLYA